MWTFSIHKQVSIVWFLSYVFILSPKTERPWLRAYIIDETRARELIDW